MHVNTFPDKLLLRHPEVLNPLSSFPFLRVAAPVVVLPQMVYAPDRLLYCCHTWVVSSGFDVLSQDICATMTGREEGKPTELPRTGG
jgi:hypothetical protein